MLLVPVLAFPACSVVPETAPAPVEERAALVHYTLGTDAAIDAPASAGQLTILELVCDPPPAQELFIGGRRRLRFADGVHEVVLRCRYRAYADAARDLFPGASRVEMLP